MARPVKRKAEKKDVILHVRVTEEQKRVLEKAAASVGADLSTYVRMTALERAKRESAAG